MSQSLFKAVYFPKVKYKQDNASNMLNTIMEIFEFTQNIDMSVTIGPFIWLYLWVIVLRVDGL